MGIRYLLGRSGNFGTHTVPLALACLNTTGPVLELSCGFYSTLLLHSLCKQQGRSLTTADHNLKWLSNFQYLGTDWHEIIHVPIPPRFGYINDFLYRWHTKTRQHIDNLWDQIGADQHWGLVLIDHLPAARRVVDLERLRPNTDVFVLHNTDRVNNFIFRFWPYLKTFNYVYEYPVTPGTVICSDKVDGKTFFDK